MTAKPHKPIEEISPGDVVMFRTETWQVTGVYLGAEYRANVIGLAPMSKGLALADPSIPGRLHEVLVPLDILKAALESKEID